MGKSFGMISGATGPLTLHDVSNLEYGVYPETCISLEVLPQLIGNAPKEQK